MGQALRRRSGRMGVLEEGPRLTGRRREEVFRKQLADEWEPKGDAPDVEGLASEIARASDQGRVVLYVASRLFFTIVRQSAELRRRGFKTFLYCMAPLNDSLRPVVQEHFDAAVDVRGGFGPLQKLLGKVRPDVVHVQCTMFQYQLGRFVLEEAQDQKVVCEFYDLTSMYAPRPHLYRSWGVIAVDCDLDSEQRICTQAAGVIHRFQPEANEELRERHGGLVPALTLWPLHSDDFALETPHGRTTCRERPRLVYAGGLTPPDTYHRQSMFPMWTMVDVVPRLLQAGFDVDILHDPGRPLDRSWGLEPYLELAARDVGFRLVEGVPPTRLAELLCQYDFGIILSDLRTGGTHCRRSLLAGSGTKLFTYLEAEIPVLTNEEFVTNARVLRDNGMGFSANSEHLESLADMVKQCDYGQLVDNVRAYNATHNMAREVDRLVAFYDSI